MKLARLMWWVLVVGAVLSNCGVAAGEYVEDRYDPFVRWNDNTNYYGYGVMDWDGATEAEKTDWFEHCASLDEVDAHPYVSGWVCLHFAVQTYVNFGGYADELPPKFSDPDWSTPNRFNLPLYAVTVAGKAYGHSINAILVGENALDFGDWFFFEPQTDQRVHPGGWNMPAEMEVKVQILEGLTDSGYRSVDLVQWHLEEDLRPVLVQYDENLVVPEPAAMLLLALGGGAFVPGRACRRRRRGL